MSRAVDDPLNGGLIVAAVVGDSPEAGDVEGAEKAARFSLSHDDQHSVFPIELNQRIHSEL